MLASVRFHFGNLSEERKGLWVWGFLGILRQREGESSFFLLGFYLGSNFGLYSKGDFLTEMTKVGNRGPTEATSSGLSDNF